VGQTVGQGPTSSQGQGRLEDREEKAEMKLPDGEHLTLVLIILAICGPLYAMVGKVLRRLTRMETFCKLHFPAHARKVLEED
jgi:hypothetical protein